MRVLSQDRRTHPRDAALRPRGRHVDGRAPRAAALGVSTKSTPSVPVPCEGAACGCVGVRGRVRVCGRAVVRACFVCVRVWAYVCVRASMCVR